MPAWTLEELRDAVRERADMEGSSFCTDSEIDGYINRSILRLRNKLIAVHGDEYFEVMEDLTTTPGTSVVELPEDFYKLTAIFWQQGPSSGSAKQRIVKYNPVDAYAGEETGGWLWGSPVCYRLQVNSLRLTPEPTAEHTIVLHYIPIPEPLTEGEEEEEEDPPTFDGFGGFEEWVILDAAIKCLVKEESDVSALLALRTDIEAEIETLADRDHAEPARVQRKLGW